MSLPLSSFFQENIPTADKTKEERQLLFPTTKMDAY